MKRQTDEIQFYIWDYLWWLGEKFSREKQDSRIDGALLLTAYIVDVIIFPLILLSTPFIPKDTWAQLLYLAFWSSATLGVMSLINRQYKYRRGDAVMRHYARRNFSQLHTLLLFILAIGILCLEMYLTDKFISLR